MRIDKDHQVIGMHGVGQLGHELVQDHRVYLAAKLIEPIFVFVQRRQSYAAAQRIDHGKPSAVVSSVCVAKADHKRFAQVYPQPP